MSEKPAASTGDQITVSLDEGTSERKRVQELLRFYQPTPVDPNDVDLNDVKLSSDPTLTALVQLGALRTDCDRAFMSLVTHEQQHILAEATKSISTIDKTHHKEGDQIFLGQRTMELGWGLCPTTLKVFTCTDDSLNVSTANITANAQGYIMGDMSKEPQFSERPFVTSFPYVRFYAEVPIFTPSGYVIGSYTVVDNKARYDGHEEVLSVLREISSAIMNHLELVTFKQTYRRASRMVSGLAHFVEGIGSFPTRPAGTRQQSTMSVTKEKSKSPPPAGNEAASAPAKGGGNPEGIPVAEKMQALEGLAVIEKVEALECPAVTEKLKTPVTDTNMSPGESHTVLHDTTLLFTDEPQEVSPAPSPQPIPQQKPSEIEMSVPTAPEGSKQITEDPLGYFDSRAGRGSESDSGIGLSTSSSPSYRSDMEDGPNTSVPSSRSNEVKETLSRACTLVRESIDLDGVLFLDASWSSYDLPYRIATKTDTPSIVNTPRSSNDGSPWPSIQLDTEQDDGSGVFDSGSSLSAHYLTSPRKPPVRKCSVVCQSIRSGYNYCDSGSENPPSLAESSLQILLGEFPRGAIFYFDESGFITSSCADDGSQSDSDIDPDLHSNVATDLLKLLPGARSIALLPLRDTTKSSWFSVGLAWSCDPVRSLRVEDFAYLRAFGDSIMVEVSRLEIISADQAKTVFLSSISHELRSPLHGILANAELLSTTSTGHVQDEMIEAIEVCGRTLLDTMDHLLDFAKINNFNKKVRPRAVDGGMSSGTNNLTSEFDMSNIVQDVVHGVLAGYKYQHTSPSQFWKRDHVDTTKNPLESYNDADSPTLYEGVTVIMDIQQRPDWVISSEPGAWKRILMNLFGNALKYTTYGFIKVSLNWEDLPSADDKAPKSLISLTVSDSGKGMSKQYLKNHLFTPFAQEDSLSVGAGLGLSIVKQLVVALGGTIKVESELGLGTVVKVSAPVVVRNITDVEKVDLISQVQKLTQGLSFCTIIDGTSSTIVCDRKGSFQRRLKPATELLRSIEQIGTSWFGMTNVRASILSSVSADIVVATEAALESYLQYVKDQERAVWDAAGSPLILLTADGSNSPYPLASVWNRDNGRVIRLPLPISPRSFAKALKKCIHYRSTSIPPPPDISDSKPQIALPSNDTTPEPKVTECNFSSNTLGKEQDVLPPPAPETQPIEPASHPVAVATTTESSATKGIETSELKQSSEGPYVLLVEDNEINLKILATFMTRLKYRYATATNGLEAVQLYTSSTTTSSDLPESLAISPSPKSSPFDFIIMDISMPIMNGFEATREIRLYEYKHGLEPVTVVALTGLASAQAQQEALSSGIDTYLMKPARLGDLRKLLGKT
ncbi:hypothetical protein F5884DRAFT_849570 [Xylogone sp. PMI_703]|nr:hypothetical protein F5884DRAFT_849570 [Xylogone sp. PMI_703]